METTGQTRSTIAIAPSDVPSKRRMAVRLAHRLADAGHRVVIVLSDGDVTADVVADTGAQRDVDVVRAGLRVVTDDRRRNPIRQAVAIRRAGREVEARRSERWATIRATGADLLVVDLEEYETMLAAVAAVGSEIELPVAALCTFFDVFPAPGVGPNEAVPYSGPTRRLRAWIAWRVTWVRMRLHDVKRQLVPHGLDRVAIARRLARCWGVRRRFTARQWLHPFVPIGVPMLVTNAVELDLPHTVRTGVHHIGSLGDPVTADLRDTDLAAALAEVDQRGGVAVLCSFGTVVPEDDAALLDRLIEVARRRPNDLFVFAGVADDSVEARCPDNVVIRHWVDQPSVLDRIDVAIVHTGNATLHECVAARVPVVAYPFRGNDQPRNAARVRHHRIGEVGDRGSDDADAVSARLDRVLHDDALRRRLAALATALQRYEDDRAAVRAVESILRG